jgi:hypothetical protein
MRYFDADIDSPTPLYPSLLFRTTKSDNCSKAFTGNDYNVAFGTRIPHHENLHEVGASSTLPA